MTEKMSSKLKFSTAAGVHKGAHSPSINQQEPGPKAAHKHSNLFLFPLKLFFSLKLIILFQYLHEKT